MKTRPSIRTLGQARAFVLRVGQCGIFSDDGGRMPSLWNVVDLPERQPGERGWGQKVMAIWNWKNELPARWPEQVFYGKIPGGLAVLMSLEYLRATHYPNQHRPIQECTPLAQKIYAHVALEPLTTAALRRELEILKGPQQTQFEKALLELQVTLNVVRRNSLTDSRDTWVRFAEQYQL